MSAALAEAEASANVSVIAAGPDCRPGAPQPSDPDLPQLTTLYTVSANVAGAFWDWRQKLVALLFTATSILFFASASLFKTAAHADRYILAALPLLLVAGMAEACRALEGRNKAILRRAYAAGAAVETAWLPVTGVYGVFTFLVQTPSRYGRVLSVIFTVATTLAVASAGALIVASIVS